MTLRLLFPAIEDVNSFGSLLVCDEVHGCLWRDGNRCRLSRSRLSSAASVERDKPHLTSRAFGLRGFVHFWTHLTCGALGAPVAEAFDALVALRVRRQGGQGRGEPLPDLCGNAKEEGDQDPLETTKISESTTAG